MIANAGQKLSGSNSSSRQTSDKHACIGKEEVVLHQMAISSGEREDDSGSHQPKRRSCSQEPEEGDADADGDGDGDGEDNKGDMNEAEYRRMRRRITNRESAKRMRVKRQEELATIQKELKKVSLENEQLRRYSGYLQKQNVVFATENQHWKAKYEGANNELASLFQQLQQVVTLSAAFNPAILEAVGKTVSTAAPQNPVVESLMQSLPQIRLLAEAMESIRTSGEGIATRPPVVAAPHVPPLSSGALTAASLSAIRQAAAANAEVRPPGVAMESRLPEVLQPTPVRPLPSSGPSATMAVDPFATLPKPADVLDSVGASEQLKALSSYFTSFNLDAILKAAQQRVSRADSVP